MWCIRKAGKSKTMSVKVFYLHGARERELLVTFTIQKEEDKKDAIKLHETLSKMWEENLKNGTVLTTFPGYITLPTKAILNILIEND
jgi:hypothetical protein